MIILLVRVNRLAAGERDSGPERNLQAPAQSAAAALAE
jgi:hypothetical protein